MLSAFFFFNDTATTEIYTLSLHDALPIFERGIVRDAAADLRGEPAGDAAVGRGQHGGPPDWLGHGVLRVVGRVGDGGGDRKSTRLNSSHAHISYAVFFLKKKKMKASRLCR